MNPMKRACGELPRFPLRRVGILDLPRETEFQELVGLGTGSRLASADHATSREAPVAGGIVPEESAFAGLGRNRDRLPPGGGFSPKDRKRYPRAPGTDFRDSTISANGRQSAFECLSLYSN